MNSQSDHPVRKVWCLLERLQKKVDLGGIPEYDFVEEVEPAGREPGRADEGGLAPGAIRLSSKQVFLPWAAGVDDVFANFDGKKTVVHVGGVGR